MPISNTTGKRRQTTEQDVAKTVSIWIFWHLCLGLDLVAYEAYQLELVRDHCGGHCEERKMPVERRTPFQALCQSQGMQEVIQ